MLFYVLFIIFLLLIIFYLARKPAKVIYKDAESEEKAKFEKIYREKENELNEILRLREQTWNNEFNEKVKRLHEELSAQRGSEKHKLEEELNKQKNILFSNLQNELSIATQQKENEVQKLLTSFSFFTSEIKQKQEDLINETKFFSNSLDELKSKHDSAIETFKKLFEIELKESFYRISFSTEELDELKELNKVIKILRNPQPFYKAIYDIYYKNKISDLVNRVVGRGRLSGIYKITHTDSGRNYVGKSVDIGDRWKQHVKRGTGAELATDNKLYSAMKELGVQNFQFEIVETTEDISKLSEMEKYWQEFFQSKEFGFSMK